MTGALLVLAGAGTTAAWGPRRLLALAPLRFVADISYELYLWHWPVLIFYLAFRDFPAVGVRGAVLVLGMSLVLAWVTRQVVARPVGLVLPRTMTPARSAGTLLAAGVATALVVVPTLVVSTGMKTREEAQLEALQHLGIEYTGAEALSARGPSTASGTSSAVGGAIREVSAEVPVQPEPELAKTDETRVDDNEDCIQEHGDGPGLDQVRMCTLLDPAEPTRTVLVAGGSHTYQWAAGINRVARKHDWRVLVAGKGQCRLKHEPELTDDCARWSANVLAAADSLDVDAVFVTGTRTHEDQREVVMPAEVAAWQELDADGIPVVTIRDNPRFNWSPPNCVRDHGRDAARCTLDRSDVFAKGNPVESFLGVPASAGHVDLSDVICKPRKCPPVVGNVMVYRDGSHLTATYLRTLRPALARAVRDAAPWLY